jgi:transcriptional regulator of NAD metabolism
MTNKQTFIKAVKQASKVFVGTQVMVGDVSYVQAVKADILFTIKDYPAEAEINYTVQDSDSVGTLVFIN